MHVSIGISLIVHVAILFVAIVGLPKPKEYDVKIRESVPIEVVTLAELTALRAQTKVKTPEKKKPEPKKAEKPPVKPKTAPPEEKKPAPVKPEPPKPKEPAPKPEAVTPAPAPKKEEAKVKKKPEPKPKEKKPEKPKKEVKKPEEKKPKPKPKKPEKKKKEQPDFDFDQIAALLDKTPEKEVKRIDNTTEEDGIPELGLDIDKGTADIITRDEKDALREQIEACWSPPVGAENAGELIVRLRIRLKPDGTLQGPPQLLNSGSSRYFEAASDSAIRAVHICQPYRMPQDKYDAWQSVILNFDPRDLAGG